MARLEDRLWKLTYFPAKIPSNLIDVSHKLWCFVPLFLKDIAGLEVQKESQT